MDINILLLGETGVGKTTFVNAFVNFLHYETLDDALEGELKILIPSSFTITDAETFESTHVIVGDPNKNENFEQDGASSTQFCRSYVFQVGRRLIRLIDAPGIGDTRGGDHDAINFDHTLSYINQYEHLNGICILLKPAETRLNVYFRYCIKELLRHLHVNAKDNIMFVFTNSRSTFYRPGDTTPILKALLKDLHKKTDVEVPFNNDNTFMFDNESFRYIAVCQQGIRFLMKEKQNYSDSWDKSVKEFSRLIRRICQCDLHAIQDTRSLNEAQLLIRKLSRPIAEIAALIQENILMAEQYKRKILSSQTRDTSVRIPQKTGQFVPLRERLTVCVNERCTEVIMVNGEQRINYKSNCHVGCSLHQAIQECIGHPVIRRCRALRKTGTCRECGCHWTKHMHITYRYERNLTYVQLDDSDSARTPQSIMALIDKRISDLRKEETAIREICVKLTQFLRANSITPLNDDMLEYLRHFVREEQQKQKEGKNNAEIIRGLEQMIEDYTEQLKLFNASSASADRERFDNTTEIEQIFDLVQRLYELPINGKFIEEQINKMKMGRAQAATKAEQYIDLPTGRGAPSILSDLRDIVSKKKR